MRYVFAALMLVFLSTSVHGQGDSEPLDDEDLLWFCILFDECDDVDDLFGDDEELSASGGKSTSTFSASGRASLTVCNDAGEEVSIAIANDVGPEDSDLFHARGWWTLADEECHDFWDWPVRDALENVPLFFLIYAESVGGTVWDGEDVFLCTPDSRFDITSAHEGNCDRKGYTDIDIFVGDRLEKGHTVSLTP